MQYKYWMIVWIRQTTNHSQITVMSNSSRLETVFGEDWLAIGDAAATYDPLSSRGIETAINHATNASDIIMQYLNGNRECLASYSKGILAKFDNYLNELSRYYRLEKRWANCAFCKQNQNYLGGYSKTSWYSRHN